MNISNSMVLPAGKRLAGSFDSFDEASYVPVRDEPVLLADTLRRGDFCRDFNNSFAADVVIATVGQRMPQPAGLAVSTMAVGVYALISRRQRRVAQHGRGRWAKVLNEMNVADILH